MDAPKEERRGYLRRLGRRIKGWFVQDAPEDIAPCEFECRRLECRQDDWEACDKRLSHVHQDERV